jgi:farnesyl diphosphate synthase
VPLLARAAGHEGMAGGQAIDLASVGKALTEDQLRHMHRLKTGALLQGSVMMGAACGEPDAAAPPASRATARALGLAFQVVDDILDVTADSATLGKTAGKDAQQDKPTYVSLLGLDRSRAHAPANCWRRRSTRWRQRPGRHPRAAALARMVVDRDN